MDTRNEMSYKCEFCKNSFQYFIPWPDNVDFLQADYEIWNKNTAICPFCFSMDRERMYRLYMEKETDLLVSANSVLHISSEQSMRKWLINNHNIHYVGGNITTEDGMRQIDITSIDYPDEMFDAVVCSYVLERVPNDLQALKELYRVMKKDGWGIFQVPISLSLQNTKEDPTIVSPQHRFRAFGQKDHVRLYARGDYVKKLQSVGFTVKPIQLSQRFRDQDIMKYGLSPKDVLYIVTKNGVPDVQPDSDVSELSVSSDSDATMEPKQVSWFLKLLQKIIS